MNDSTRSARDVRRGTLLYTSALLIAGAALIHLAVAPQHFEEYVPFGVFFVGAGLAQLAVVVALVAAPRRWLLAAGAAGQALVIGLWVVTRTTGLPVGPHPGEPEGVGFPDLICTTMEALSVLALAVLAARVPRPRLRRPAPIALATAPALVVVAVATGGGVAGARNDMPAAASAAPAVPGRPSASVASLTQPSGTGPVRSFTLTARVSRIDGRDAWTYDGTVPGPELRVRQGDHVHVTLVNRLPEATTIHWHGIAVPNAEDGVAGVTQNAVPPGSSTTYDFVARDVGTYWYHSHQDTADQIPRGLFGALIVEPPAGRVADQRDYAVVLHQAVGGNTVEADGAARDLHLDARPGERVRLRLIDATEPALDGRPLLPVLLGAPYKVTALDGQDLEGPQELGPQLLPLDIGQRMDLVFTMPASGAVRLVDAGTGGRPNLLQRVFAQGGSRSTESVTIGDGQAPSAGDTSRLPTFDLTRYGTSAADPVAAGPIDAMAPVVLTDQGGLHDGRPELVQKINGEASPATRSITVRPGQLVRLHIVNETPEYHPMHLHGHTFSLVSKNGTPLRGSPVRQDTLLVGPHETWDVAFLADNPGIWMFHCHVLSHASFGMSTTVNYAGVTTPYEMGTRSGNVPE